MSNVPLYKITLGGWYQRTTLHLSELYDFMAHGTSHLSLSADKLKAYQASLGIVELKREAGYLEYIKAKTKSGIEIRFYEDGLYVVEHSSSDVLAGQKMLEHYLNNIFSPALSYLFSQGAPTPKVLANIKTAHPVVVTVTHPKNFTIDPKKFGEPYSTISSGDITVIKTPSHIFILGINLLDELVEMQIFFREFKDQLAKYLDIHRLIWEDISVIKEKKHIKGKEVALIRSKLDSYQKTISLISNRINQMGAYVHTRSSISKNLKLEETLVTLFQYKFEVLLDTLDYIKEIWKMTTDYLNTAIQVITEIIAKTTYNSITSLRVITTIGVIASIVTYLAKDSFPHITVYGLFFFSLLILMTMIVNTAIEMLYKERAYDLKFTETTKDM